MIAIAAVLKPSKTMRLCATLFAILLLIIGAYIGCLKTPNPLNQYAFTAICFFAAWRIYLYQQQIAKTAWHMNIDGQGQLRCQSKPFSSQALDSNPLKLGAGTTLWARALFLRIYNQKEKVTHNLIVFPDMISKDEFRRLSVACRWIIARQTSDRR